MALSVNTLFNNLQVVKDILTKHNIDFVDGVYINYELKMDDGSIPSENEDYGLYDADMEFTDTTLILSGALHTSAASAVVLTIDPKSGKVFNEVHVDHNQFEGRTQEVIRRQVEILRKPHHWEFLNVDFMVPQKVELELYRALAV